MSRSISKFLLLICLSMLMLTLQACGKKDDDNSSNKNQNNNLGNNNLLSEPLSEQLPTEREEILCRKYLGANQNIANQPTPNTYQEGVEYLRKALFFFPDDPKQMTDEQKELFKAPCFWAGMKMRFVEGGNVRLGNANGDGTSPRLPFPQANKTDILKHLDMYRYYVFTERFFNQIFNQTFHKEFCESVDDTNPDPWHGPGFPNKRLRTCNSEVALYSDGDPNDFYNQFRNTDLKTPMKNLQYVTDMEVLLVIRNIRFGSKDGMSNYINAGNAIQSDAAGMQGYRGRPFDKATKSRIKPHFDFKPLEVINTIKNYGEIAININRPLEAFYNPIMETDINKLAYETDWAMHPNQDAITKNIAPQVQYWGWQTEYDMFIKDTDLGLLMHETMHNMGYAHGDRNEIQGLNNAIDIPYYVQQIIILEGNPHYYTNIENPYWQAVNNGVIPAYYNTPKFMQSVQVH